MSNRRFIPKRVLRKKKRARRKVEEIRLQKVFALCLLSTAIKKTGAGFEANGVMVLVAAIVLIIFGVYAPPLLAPVVRKISLECLRILLRM